MIWRRENQLLHFVKPFCVQKIDDIELSRETIVDVESKFIEVISIGEKQFRTQNYGLQKS